MLGEAIVMRRLIAAGATLVVLILIVLGVRSCQISARNSSLKDYTNNVSSLNQQSSQTGQQFFPAFLPIGIHVRRPRQPVGFCCGG